MNKNVEQAKKLLQTGITLALCRGDETVTSCERGVKPLLNLLSRQTSWNGFGAADKVVGKASALLYVQMEVEAVYAFVISDAAFSVLDRYGIQVTYETRVPSIRNRAGTGMCPMEQAVWETDDPKEAVELIRNKLKDLAGGVL